jgi:hypothetical protein
MRCTTTTTHLSFLLCLCLGFTGGCSPKTEQPAKSSQSSNSSSGKRATTTSESDRAKQASEALPTGPPIDYINFATLFNEWQDNPVATAKKLRKHRVRIKFWTFSKVTTKEKPTEILGEIGQVSVSDHTPVYGVIATLSRSGEAEYARDKGQGKWLVGRVTGTKNYPENIHGGFAILLEDCDLVSPSSTK